MAEHMAERVPLSRRFQEACAGLPPSDAYALLRYADACERLAEAVDAHYPPYTEVPPVLFRAALAAYREARS